MSRTLPLAAVTLAVALAAPGLLACGGPGSPESAHSPEQHPAGVKDEPGVHTELDDELDDELELGMGATADPRPPYTPISKLGPALETRRANRTRLVFARPDPDSDARGRIPAKQRFFVYATEAGPGCRREWAQVADAAWVCLDRCEIDTETPLALPLLRDGDPLPFVYARHRRHRREDTPDLPVYRSTRAMNAGEAPLSSLPAYGSYAFTRYRHNHGAPVMVTPRGRVVPAAELRRFQPSALQGRDLLAAPVPSGRTLAWAVHRDTRVYARPDASDSPVLELERHTSVELRTAEPGVGDDGRLWFELADRGPGGADGASGRWISAEDLRRWLPLPPEPGEFAEQVVIDVDLDEQVLSVWRGEQPVFATLVSSGKAGDRTPLGVYRMRSKWAYGKMASLPDAEVPYFVDAVPWAMYFSGRYALHAAYWHDQFGQRKSHGCINLSPRDAKRVFELSTPTLPDGWLVVHEHSVDPGTLVRVRRGARELPDRRRPLDPID